ncbi:Chromatin-remodeling complexes subunit ngg1 like protein [Verticillium longisporum]|nr:Chromatin-remodeling complexes subunit ngg1 like protein [Verticillium longisporum]
MLLMAVWTCDSSLLSKKKKDEKEKKEDEAVEDEEDEEESSSEDEGAPPRRDLPAAHTFGDDPSTFPDPTHDLAELELIAGDPPDKDFSNAKPSNQISFSTFSAYIEPNAKPSNQISFSTFSAYIEPYFRPFTEEDLGFLRERGDRVAPFHMPKRGKRHYTEIWAEEDGAMQVDSPSKREKLAPNVPRGTIDRHYTEIWAEEDGAMQVDSPSKREKLAPNVPRGTIDVMDDEVGETDKLSVGPLLSRLVSIMRPESRPPTDEDKPNVNGTANGDVSMAGSINGDNGDLSMSFGGGGGGGGEENKPPTMPPATTPSAKRLANPRSGASM